MSNSKDSSRRDRFKQTTMGNYLTRSKDDKKPRMTKKKSILEDEEHGYGASFFGQYRRNDLDSYRKGYPGKEDEKSANDNWKFYNNELESYPNGDYIDEIHRTWFQDYRRLEQHHGYIQWLFPIRESGMNFHAQELQLHEAEKIQNDPKAYARVLKSYELMLDFYGMEFVNKKDKRYLKRSSNYKERFGNLNRSYHNYLRITRILKSLGELGYEYLKKPFIEFVLQEALEEETIPNTLDSCVKYWLETIKEDKDREELKMYIRKMEEGYGTEHPPDAPTHKTDFSDQKMEESEKDEKKTTGVENEAGTYDYEDNRRRIDVDEDSQEAGMIEEALREEEEKLRQQFSQDNQEICNRDVEDMEVADKQNESENTAVTGTQSDLDPSSQQATQSYGSTTV